MYHTSVAYRIVDIKDYVRLNKRGIKVQFIYSNKRTLIVEFRINPSISKIDFKPLESLAAVICGGMSDFENYCEFNNIDSPSKLDFSEYNRQVEIYKKLENFFSYKEFDGSVGTNVINYAKEFFHDWIVEEDSLEHYRL